MKEFNLLTPAQTLLIIEGKNASLNELLKLTFMDLLLKQVLVTSRRNFRPSKYDPSQVITYVTIGKNFIGYKPSLHELVFLQPFQKNKSLSIMFRHTVKMGNENSKGKNQYQKIIVNTSELSSYIKSNFLQNLFGGFSLTKNGEFLKNKLQENLAYLEEYLPSVITSDKPKALEILKEIKGNIFLLKNIEFELFTEIDKKLAIEMNRNRKNENSDGAGCTSIWNTFGHDWHSFDSSCSSNDSGCGGSGCSGCSGCGGCGGD